MPQKEFEPAVKLLGLKQQFWKLSAVLFKGASQNVTLALCCNVMKNLKKFCNILGSRILSDATYLLRLCAGSGIKYNIIEGATHQLKNLAKPQKRLNFKKSISTNTSRISTSSL